MKKGNLYIRASVLSSSYLVELVLEVFRLGEQRVEPLLLALAARDARALDRADAEHGALLDLAERRALRAERLDAATTGETPRGAVRRRQTTARRRAAPCDERTCDVDERTAVELRAALESCAHVHSHKQAHKHTHTHARAHTHKTHAHTNTHTHKHAHHTTGMMAEGG